MTIDSGTIVSTVLVILGTGWAGWLSSTVIGIKTSMASLTQEMKDLPCKARDFSCHASGPVILPPVAPIVASSSHADGSPVSLK